MLLDGSEVLVAMHVLLRELKVARLGLAHETEARVQAEHRAQRAVTLIAKTAVPVDVKLREATRAAMDAEKRCSEAAKTRSSSCSPAAVHRTS